MNTPLTPQQITRGYTAPQIEIAHPPNTRQGGTWITCQKQAAITTEPCRLMAHAICQTIRAWDGDVDAQVDMVARILTRFRENAVEQ